MTGSSPSERVLVVGDALIDELREPSGSLEVAGGSALNVAVGLSLLGVPAALVAMVGDDAGGDLLRAHLATFDVPLFATNAPHGTGRAVSDRTAGEPRYSFNRASRERTLRLNQVAEQAFAFSRWIIVSGYPFDDAVEVATLRRLIADGHHVAIDPNPRSGMLRDSERFRDNLLLLSRDADLVKIGSEDAELIFQADLAEAAAELRDAGAKAVVATAGAEGASVLTASYAVSRGISSRFGSAPVIDTMGAGDATFASLLSELVRTESRPFGVNDWELSLERAMRIAAATVRASGGLLRIPESA